MNQLIYQGDFLQLHNMKRFPEGLYKVIKIDIDFIDQKPFLFCENEQKTRVKIEYDSTEHYIKSVIRTPRPTKTRLC